ncbi:MAG: 16S rRNA processing protein RimM [Candidatus Marinimicrobia bacterium]|nr:16S rRNA processing protein RimM [Candidatus Neomarinimicrobiota bacterium]|tara:strand:- start:16597 stop:17094 length:498 start_codon:yes stop_codon:yes gene_type:complete
MAKRLKPAAKVIKAVGLKGDVKVYPFDGSFEQYVNEKFLYVGDDPTTTQTLQLSAIAKTGKFIRYAVQGNESREDAEDLVGKLIFTPADEDEILPEEIIGFLVVTTEGKPIGILADIMPIRGQDIYAIDSGRKEILIPAVPEIVRQIRFDSRTITIEPMEGLLDL